MKKRVQMISISSPRCLLLLSVLEKTYTPCAARYQLSLVLARFRLVAQISIWSSLVGLVERSLENGGTVREYRYTGVSGPMLLPITEAWCIEYTLLFDPQKVLRYWLRKDCGQSLDLNSASANELRTLPGLRGVDVSRIIAGRPYQSRDELLTREIVPQPT